MTQQESWDRKNITTATIAPEIVIHPLSNTAFTHIFAECQNDPKREYALRCLLNAILADKNDPLISKIASAHVESAKPGTYAFERGCRFDIDVVDNNNRIYLVEVQLLSLPEMIDRLVYYYGRYISTVHQVGEEGYLLPDVVSIGLLNFTLTSHPNFHISAEIALREEPHHPLFDRWRIHLVEFPKFRKVQFDPKNPLHVWVRYFMDYNDSELVKELCGMTAGLSEYVDYLSVVQSDPTARAQYEVELKDKKDAESRMKSARKEGREEGEERKALEIARGLLGLLDMQTIADKTGLPLEVVQKLAK